MYSIIQFIKRNSTFILHFCITVILCIFLSKFFEVWPDYLLFGNVILALINIFWFYKMLFKKILSDSFLKMICTVIITISANHLYSYKKLCEVFPFFINIDQRIFIIGLSVSLIIVLLITKLIMYVEKINKSHILTKESAPIEVKNIPTSSDTDHNLHTDTSLHTRQKSKNILSFFQYIGICLFFCILTIVPAVLLYYFHKDNLDQTYLDFDKFFNFYVSYGASFLLIIFAFALVIITFIYFARFIFFQVKSFRKTNKKEEEETSSLPTYVLSVIIVCSLLFIAWRITDFSLADLTNTLVVGDYLALPIAVLIIIILFFLLVQLTHAILLTLRKMSVEQAMKLIEWNKEIGSIIVKIIKMIIEIILNTILGVLEFVEFVPNFFQSLSSLVLEEDEIEKNENKGEK